ncbi:Plasmodium exported protein, unknown function [Plasmodium berghei]|uniref:CRA domain-containing protein n=1 Tax=Plasmodium berghei TaxID=5821 RepID=A0A0Y9PS29_PLABE|nr:Plasmodium exported protein, unknown function [Plasmodium berghei]
MNTKLYSLFVFIYLIIVYCATVHGNKNDNGKNNGNGLSFIKKIYQNDNNKDNKHVQRTGEDGIGDVIVDILKKEYVDPHIIKLVDIVNKKENKLKKINERKHIYQLLAMSLGALFISRLIYDIKGQYMSSIENPNSMINKLKNKLTTKKTKL